MSKPITDPRPYLDGKHILLWRLNNIEIGISTDWSLVPKESILNLLDDGLLMWKASIEERPGDRLEFVVFEGEFPED